MRIHLHDLPSDRQQIDGERQTYYFLLDQYCPRKKPYNHVIYCVMVSIHAIRAAEYNFAFLCRLPAKKKLINISWIIYFSCTHGFFEEKREGH